MRTDEAPIVAVNGNAANPHFSTGEGKDVLADRTEMGIEDVRHRLLYDIPSRSGSGLCLVLLEPCLDAGMVVAKDLAAGFLGDAADGSKKLAGASTGIELSHDGSMCIGRPSGADHRRGAAADKQAN